MRRLFRHIISVTVLLFPLLAIEAKAGSGREARTFDNSNVLKKGEVTAGIGILSANISSTNSQLLLMAQNLGGEGSLLHISPNCSVAYKDNASVGVRFSYNTAALNLDSADFSLLGIDLSASLQDVAVGYRTRGASVFHRNYLGLEKSGTVGLFCEFELGYSSSALDYGQGQSNSLSHMGLSFNPGLILYILPMVSLETSLGLADVTYTISSSHDADMVEGRFNRFGGGVKLNILNSNFGISYHF